MSKFMAVLNKKREISKKQKSMLKQIYFISLHVVILSLLIYTFVLQKNQLIRSDIEKIAFGYAMKECVKQTQAYDKKYNCGSIEIRDMEKHPTSWGNKEKQPLWLIEYVTTNGEFFDGYIELDSDRSSLDVDY